MIYLELRRSSSMIFGLLRWSQSLQFLLVSLLLTSGCSSAQRSQRSRGVFCHFSPCFLHLFWEILSWGYRMVMPLTSCFLSATRPRKISKDLERSRKIRMSSAMLSCCPMSLGHVTGPCHMSHHVTSCHIMSHHVTSCHKKSSHVTFHRLPIPKLRNANFIPIGSMVLLYMVLHGFHQ